MSAFTSTPFRGNEARGPEDPGPIESIRAFGLARVCSLGALAGTMAARCLPANGT
jgi:hypothetical protein